ncbi:EGF domain-specific O-linked N-acetylglucosamine transferase-like [Haliotis rubra]|uniref:EGF domain-specific O-linked N-acetylglucosamine transferase-like n=1 Tax=Haliotis rubra TaxID=36100 RepID=UPI001EE56769|nr:EGF domain-specific O-linked N-acetylglucosamine transferase-like [Haliotis rubra]
MWSHLLTLVVTVGGATDWGDLRLPLEHVPYFFRNNPDIKQRCKDEDACPYKTDSSLECTDALGFCRGRNVYLDLRNANMATRDRYRNDIVHNITFGGHCDLDKVGLDAAMTSPVINKRPLASWMQEMEHFSSLPTQPLATGECDVIIDRPTVIIKMDEGMNGVVCPLNP